MPMGEIHWLMGTRNTSVYRSIHPGCGIGVSLQQNKTSLWRSTLRRVGCLSCPRSDGSDCLQLWLLHWLFLFDKLFQLALKESCSLHEFSRWWIVRRWWARFFIKAARCLMILQQFPRAIVLMCNSMKIKNRCSD